MSFMNVKKTCRNVLTKGVCCGILSELSERQRQSKQQVKKTQRKFEKALDKVHLK